MVHGTIASTQVSTHSSHPLRYPFTYLRKLRDWGGGGGAACFEGEEGGAWGSYHRWIKAMLFVVKLGTWWYGFG